MIIYSPLRIARMVVTLNLVHNDKRVYHIDNLAIVNQWTFEELFPQIRNRMPEQHKSDFDECIARIEQDDYSLLQHVSHDRYGFNYYKNRDIHWCRQGKDVASYMITMGFLEVCYSDENYNKKYTIEYEDQFGRRHTEKRTHYELFRTPFTYRKAVEIEDQYMHMHNYDEGVDIAIHDGMLDALEVLNEWTKY